MATESLEAEIKLGKLLLDNTAVFLCDLQEKLLPVMLHQLEVVKNAKKLVESTRILDVPLIVTEQYPQGLGNTCRQLDVEHAVGIYPKTKFSMVVPEVESTIQNICGGHLKCAILFGVEAHVCVEQTAIDLIQKGIKVHIVADATTSRTQEDRILAFERLKQIGCFISTTEAVIFKLVGDKEHPQFNQIRPLIKETTAQTGLVSRIMGEEMTNKNDFTRKLEKKLPTPPSTVKGTNSSTPIKCLVRKRTHSDVESSKGANSSGTTELKCSKCPKLFSRVQDVKRHSKTHSSLNDFLCEVCGKNFRSQDGLTYHVTLSHSFNAEGGINCQECGKFYASRYQLKVHLKNSHLRAKSHYTCPVCSKEFQRSDVFQSHMARHGGKSFGCQKCDKSFASKSNLNAHQRTHDSSLSLQCSICCKKFNSKKKLTAHVTQCLNAKLCRSCKFSCQRQEDLVEHVKKTHPADYAMDTVFGDSLTLIDKTVIH